MQMQSLQSFHNKAVPAAALLFVLVEQANSLPVSSGYFVTRRCRCTHKVIFPSRTLLLYSNHVKMTLTCLTFFVQLKKSGKEPKAGAELVCGNTTYRTKVEYNSTSNFCKVTNSVNHFHYINVCWGLFEKFPWPRLNIFIQTTGLWLHLLVLFKITNLNNGTWKEIYSPLSQNIEIWTVSPWANSHSSCLCPLLSSLKVCDRSRSPIWSEAFHFLVHDPREEMLIIKVSAVWFSVSVHCTEENKHIHLLPLLCSCSFQVHGISQWDRS